MKDLLRDLASHAREREEHELSLWNGPTATTDAADQIADAALLQHLFRPLDSKAVDRIVANAVDKAAPPAPAPVRSIQSRRGAWIGALALAAALVLVVVFRGGDGEPIPPYVAELAGGDDPRPMGPDVTEQRVLLRAESRVALTLRPERAIEGDIGVRAFLAGDGGARPFDAPFVVATNGTVRLTGVAGELFREVPDGAFTIVVAVGRKRSLPESFAEADRLSTQPTASVRVLKKAFVLSRAAPR